MKYKITFLTGNQSGAGTDADISIIVYGSLLKTKPISLNQHKNENVFEKDKIDVFFIETADLGLVEKIDIWHNDKWFGADWFLEHLSLENLSNGKSYFFMANKWIKGNSMYEFFPVDLVNYNVEISTGTLPGSGSNSNLFISLVGSKNYTNFINLKPYLSKKEFITGHTETFTIQNDDHKAAVVYCGVAGWSGGTISSDLPH